MTPEPFTLTAIPGIIGEGEDKGHLEFVTFVAQNSIMFAKWTAVNVGTFVDDFGRIIPADEAADVVSRLRAGESVRFPGFWALDEIKHKFDGSGND
jgi:hypothetical protein